MGLTVSVCVCGGEDTELGKRRTQELHANLDLQFFFTLMKNQNKLQKRAKGNKLYG